jgi:hypothetical protein
MIWTECGCAVPVVSMSSSGGGADVKHGYSTFRVTAAGEVKSVIIATDQLPANSDQRVKRFATVPVASDRGSLVTLLDGRGLYRQSR